MTYALSGTAIDYTYVIEFEFGLSRNLYTLYRNYNGSLTKVY